MNSELLRLTGVSKYYGETGALRNIDCSVARGEWVTIMGPSGSGKTTLLSIIGGLSQSSEGAVLFNGDDLTLLSEAELAKYRRENVGFIFQQHHLINYLSAVENVMMAQFLHSMPDEREAIARVAMAPCLPCPQSMDQRRRPLTVGLHRTLHRRDADPGPLRQRWIAQKAVERSGAHVEPHRSDDHEDDESFGRRVRRAAALGEQVVQGERDRRERPVSGPHRGRSRAGRVGREGDRHASSSPMFTPLAAPTLRSRPP